MAVIGFSNMLQNKPYGEEPGFSLLRKALNPAEPRFVTRGFCITKGQRNKGSKRGRGFLPNHPLILCVFSVHRFANRYKVRQIAKSSFSAPEARRSPSVGCSLPRSTEGRLWRIFPQRYPLYYRILLPNSKLSWAGTWSASTSTDRSRSERSTPNAAMLTVL